MSVIDMAVSMLQQQLGQAGSNVDAGALGEAVQGLLGGGDGELDLGKLVSGFQEAGLGGVVSSWLGDGANDGIDVGGIASVLGEQSIGEAASKLGVDSEVFGNALSQALPQIVDQNSTGGDLMSSALSSAASSILNKLF